MTAEILNPEQRARLSEAIRTAESRTSGEIYCVLARSSDSYLFPALAVLSFCLLLASLIVALGVEWQWLQLRLPVFVLAQLLAFACGTALLAALPRLRPWLVPRGLKYRRAHDSAVKQFLARNIHMTNARTGVLLFVSLAERYAEVIADAGINERVPQEHWDGVVSLLTEQARRGDVMEGFGAAIAAVGATLAEHFPPLPEDENELDDHIVEI